ncbi:RNA polymerase sigma factor [Spirosoma sp. RP8]|uniref:RNA polymerase sigma factor n=1 Tax=Spirosoma liriopis TaxID=2937440 RepID=A0ABT0HFX5_9BACT|nr:RNA polymerase sigma factor [Spirosoma liriopis]MCK8491053.1 RNA polymerase sigma factor [Spirosoma liriopis]
MATSKIFDDEPGLWNAFQQGDIRAFELIYRTHSSMLLSYGRRLCSDHDLVNDVVQDVFVEIWTRRSTLRDLHTIKYYLFRIVRNKLSKLRASNLLVAVDEDDRMDDEQLLSPSIEFLITQQETSNDQAVRLQQAITKLPSRQREAITLAFYHDFSNEEIAGIMGINHQSVINHLNRALTFLRDLLTSQPIVAILIGLFL